MGRENNGLAQEKKRELEVGEGKRGGRVQRDRSARKNIEIYKRKERVEYKYSHTHTEYRVEVVRRMCQ